ncbi:MAG: ABC transporter permease [Melioribacteraceae bacterium]
MLNNYFKIIIRNLIRSRVYSFINIVGLAVGVTCFILLSLYVLDEVGHDRFYKDSDRIYRIYVHSFIAGEETNNSKTSAPMAETLFRDLPEVETFTRIGYTGAHTLSYGDKKFREGSIYTADSTFFKIFSLKFIYGDSKTALVQPNSIVISEDAANKYFGNENPLGKTFNVDDSTTYLITGVVENFPDKSHFSCPMLLSMSTMPDSRSDYWLNLWFSTYVKMKEGTNPVVFQNKMKQTVIKYVGPIAERVLGVPIQQFLNKGNIYEFLIQPLNDIYLYSQTKYNIDPNTEWSNVKYSNIAYSYIFMAIALFILLIAVINFMNLSTAHSEKRAKEVGIRKTLGSNKSKLIWQFISESIFMSFLAVIFALLLLQFVFPYFNDFISRDLKFGLFSNLFTIPSLIIFTLIVGIAAGSYPAFYLSSFQPAHIVKKVSGKKSRKTFMRSFMVIVQFAISITLIIGTIIIKNQLDFIQNKDLGFKKEHLITLPNLDFMETKIKAFKTELLKNSNIVSATLSSLMFRSGIPGNGYLYNQRAGTDPVSAQFVDVDKDFIKTYGVKLKEGRFFSDEFATDSNAVLINESAQKEFRANDPVGKELVALANKAHNDVFHIIGIVKDFNYESLHRSIRPLVFHYHFVRQPAKVMTLRINSNNLKETINYIESVWKEFAGSEKFYYNFLDDTLAQLYSTEQKIGQITTVFAMLAIFIACLGLFGLATFVTEQRIKEIGIRKVLGASVPELILLLSKEFTKWVILANIIAWPVAYFVMNKWLQDFAYRIDISWNVFVFAGIIALIIALATVSYQAIKAALTNPVESLRYE